MTEIMNKRQTKYTYWIERKALSSGILWWRKYRHPFCIIQQSEHYSENHPMSPRIIVREEIVQECDTLAEAEKELKYWQLVSN